MMNTPEYPSTLELSDLIQNSSFKVKMRGYAPEEVDEFMDRVVAQLRRMEEKLEELRRYDTWLRTELQGQILSRAQQEAQKILQEAQDQSRALMDSARLNAEKERAELDSSIQQQTRKWNEQKASQERELNDLRRYIADYRAKHTQALNQALNDLRREQQRDDEGMPAYVPHAASVEPLLSPLGAPAPFSTQPTQFQEGNLTPVNSSNDIDALLAEIKKQVR